MNLSSHDVVHSTLKVPKKSLDKENENLFSHTYKPFEQKRIIWDLDNTKAYETASNKILRDMEDTFDTPECIPLKCELYSNLLVTCAEKTLKIKASTTRKPKMKFSHRQNQAWKRFNKSYRVWCTSGKLRDKNNINYSEFKEARSNFQRVRRYEDSLKHIKHNNQPLALQPLS